MQPIAARRMTAAVALVGVFAAAGCSSNRDVPPMVQGDRFAANQVAFADADVADVIRVGAVTRSFDGAGVMHVSVEVRPTTDYDPGTLQYQVVYYDENHVPIDVPVGWHDLPLTANTYAYVTGNSTTPRARDFLVTFRAARMTSVGGE